MVNADPPPQAPGDPIGRFEAAAMVLMAAAQVITCFEERQLLHVQLSRLVGAVVLLAIFFGIGIGSHVAGLLEASRNRRTAIVLGYMIAYIALVPLTLSLMGLLSWIGPVYLPGKRN